MLTKWVLESDFAGIVEDSYSYLGLLPLRAEALLWFEKSGVDTLRRYAKGVRSQGDRRLAAHVERMHLVFDNPEHLRYFEAGIWDMSLIERYVASGVDASLAAEIASSETKTRRR